MVRITLEVWIDFEFGHSTTCSALLGQFGVWQYWLGSWA